MHIDETWRELGHEKALRKELSNLRSFTNLHVHKAQKGNCKVGFEVLAGMVVNITLKSYKTTKIVVNKKIKLNFKYVKYCVYCKIYRVSWGHTQTLFEIFLKSGKILKRKIRRRIKSIRRHGFGMLPSQSPVVWWYHEVNCEVVEMRVEAIPVFVAEFVDFFFN
jgi:hypothetical protein